MRLTSSKGCLLAIGTYPHFIYNASGGGGEAIIMKKKVNDSKYVEFCPKTFQIPSLNWKTTKFLNLPLPPGINIKMVMDKLGGNINTHSGEINLDFEARFSLQIFSKIVFPDLKIICCLTTNRVKTKLFEREGEKIKPTGEAKIVGIATIKKTNNYILDKFLSLPNEALAELKCVVESN